eukprot:TRINITY_DN3331_c0_g1_i1.p1 TRINITY_DN3331_c0_g1~~TRINITY_DN3331_c0_g1_i1.p1  ORF type:complete len:609 (+),score=123.30 TRINITY_DN3331_c0_g1_i1:1192-3018(+)
MTKRSRSSDSSESSKRTKKKSKKEKKMMKELEKQGKREGEYIIKVGKVVEKVLSHNEKEDKGRPLSLVKAAVASALGMLMAIKKDPHDIKQQIIPVNDERMLYLKNINYGIELFLRLGFEEGKDEGEAVSFYGLKEKAAPLIEFAMPILQKALVTVTAKIPKAIRRLEEDTLGDDGLKNLINADVTICTSKAVGTALGCMAGDILGLPCADWNSKVIERWFGTITEFHALPPAQRNNNMNIERYWVEPKPKTYLGCYSGEVATCVSIALDILEKKKLDCKSIVKRTCSEYNTYMGHGKRRMFRESMKVQLDKMRAGEDARKIGMCINPQGLQGADGPALMPFLALLCSNTEDDEVILNAVKGVLLPYIVHPDGIGTSFVFLHALRYLFLNRDEFNPSAFVALLIEKTGLLTMSNHLMRSLKALQRLMNPKTGAVPEKYLSMIEDEDTEDESETVFTSAIGVVCGAVYALLNNFQQPIMAISCAVGLGEAGNTLGQLTGAMCGALHGAEWVPMSWFTLIENGDGVSVPGVGRDRVIQLAIDCSSTTLFPKIHNLEKPQTYTARKYQTQKGEAEEETSSAAPDVPKGTDALVAAMPISLRKYAPEAAFKP